MILAFEVVVALDHFALSANAVAANKLHRLLSDKLEADLARGAAQFLLNGAIVIDGALDKFLKFVRAHLFYFKIYFDKT